MKTACIAWAAAALLTSLTLAPTAIGAKTKAGSTAPVAPPVPAAITWQKTCSRCHTTGVGPELRGRDLPPDYIATIVRSGFLAMPAFPHSALDDASLAAVAKMVSQSKAPSGAKNP
ncbi:cytochrome c [Novosphingobium sp. 1949]|uniref:Cytochrome c n=1 Tax=Novosphingobium organovorum TaxID=2930092 RepID=A0ABT0BJ38_9SPHN|nr:cytochrome c [Novosphingobium organovorum]MCJ2185072.1 cytochrome c [Novosphingobium organovorum]